MEKKIKHLEMIQNVIERMGNNSFLIKGWSITLVSAIFVVAIQGEQKIFALWTLFPALIFWLLDGFYLRKERLLRALYDQVRKLDEKKIDFSMDTSNIVNGKIPSKGTGFLSAIFSRTLLPFHGGMILAIAIAAIVFLYF
ncbi:MAG: hypothetical protein Q8L41_13240 [Anaerolineales bacterium]|nr:hypothetical protein [Anaerolineales bacterium]